MRWFSKLDLSTDVEGEIQRHEASRKRVLKLINKMNESIVRSDFTSPLWDAIRYEATVLAEADMKAATFMNNAILSQSSLDEALIDIVSNELETPLFPATQIRNLFADIFASNRSIPRTISFDLIATAMHDSPFPNVVSVLLFHKGYHALVAHRIANVLWYRGQEGLARYFQSLSSRTFGVDIHPACRIDRGCYLANGCSIVIGETATIGIDCYISHGVTLGGTGKESGNRHPKVGDGVFIGAGAAVLGNIKIGDGAIVNAGAVVTKPVEPFTRVGGVPARFISRFVLNATSGRQSADWIAEISEKSYPSDDTRTALPPFNTSDNLYALQSAASAPSTFPVVKIDYYNDHVEI